jgi:hypothetical protein
VGATRFVLSNRDAAAAESADDYEQYIERMDRAEQRRTWSWIALGSGAAIATAAAVRYWIADDTPADRGAPTLTGAVILDGDAIGITAFGRF